MFNFKLSSLWLFGILIIVLVVSMIWYNNTSIEGFVVGKEIENYPNELIEFGMNDSGNRNFFDQKTSNVIINYDQNIAVINRAGEQTKYIKSELKEPINVENVDIHKGTTYAAISIYEDTHDEQLFYISHNDYTFIHSIDLHNNLHKKSFVFNDGRIIKEEKALIDSSGSVSTTSTVPTSTFNSKDITIDTMTINVKELATNLYYDPSNQLLIQKEETVAEAGTAVAVRKPVPANLRNECRTDSLIK